jgi:hypothetical protein
MSLLKKQHRIGVSLITGPCCLNKHLHRMGLTTTPVCATCQLKEETALYFVCVCPTFATLRTCIFGKPIMNASEFTDALALNVLKKKLCHKIFEKPRKKQKFDNIFDRFCLNHKPLYSNCFLPTRKKQNTNTVLNQQNFNKTIYL